MAMVEHPTENQTPPPAWVSKVAAWEPDATTLLGVPADQLPVSSHAGPCFM